MTEIVVGYDGSSEAERALVRAADFAKALSANLVVVSVSNFPEVPEAVPTLAPVGPAAVGGTAVPTLSPEPSTASEAEIERSPRAEELAHRQLEQARMALANRQIEAEFLAEEGDFADRLLEVAEGREAGLIVVGSREHGFLERLLSRPAEEAVARRADRDVLLVH
jgi:nucleotide-binding universal stress UspA family protein